MARPLDDVDRAILAILQPDAKATLDHISAAVGLSPAAVQRRIQRLRHDRVIASSATVVDPAAAGVPLLVLTLITLERDGADDGTALDQTLTGHPNIQQAFELAGNFDRAVMITAPDMDTYRSITRELFDTNPNVKRYSSHVVLTRLKQTLHVPL